jgi:hypothetical protein
MSEISEIKTQSINDLWLPKVKKAGEIFYPKLRKNKKMKLLTLTDDRNFQEIKVFEENSLTTKDCVIAWTYSHIKKLRLETELSPTIVFGPARYEDSISSSSFSLRSHFPFDVINLDFSSQDPYLETGRVEKEIECLEKTIILQSAQRNKEFVLVYTTLLNSNSLNYMSIVSTSNAVHVPGWSGIPSGNFPPSITDQMEKIRCIESVLSEICLKYNYNGEFEKRFYSVGGTRKYICSIAGLVSRR